MKTFAILKAGFDAAGWLVLIFGGSLLAIAAAVGGWLAQKTHMLAAYAPLSYAAVALCFAAVMAVLMVAVAGLRLLWRRADAVEFWKKSVDRINPLDQEFHRRRIRVNDLADPLTNRVQNKRFIDCELVGPSVMLPWGGTRISRLTFRECDIVVLRPDVHVSNAIVFENCEILGGKIDHMTLLVTDANYQVMLDDGLAIAAITARPNRDGPAQR